MGIILCVYNRLSQTLRVNTRGIFLLPKSWLIHVVVRSMYVVVKGFLLEAIDESVRLDLVIKVFKVGHYRSQSPYDEIVVSHDANVVQ